MFSLFMPLRFKIKTKNSYNVSCCLLPPPRLRHPLAAPLHHTLRLPRHFRNTSCTMFAAAAAATTSDSDSDIPPTAPRWHEVPPTTLSARTAAMQTEFRNTQQQTHCIGWQLNNWQCSSYSQQVTSSHLKTTLGEKKAELKQLRETMIEQYISFMKQQQEIQQLREQVRNQQQYIERQQQIRRQIDRQLQSHNQTPPPPAPLPAMAASPTTAPAPPPLTAAPTTMALPPPSAAPPTMQPPLTQI